MPTKSKTIQTRTRAGQRFELLEKETEGPDGGPGEVSWWLGSRKVRKGDDEGWDHPDTGETLLEVK